MPIRESVPLIKLDGPPDDELRGDVLRARKLMPSRELMAKYFLRWYAAGQRIEPTEYSQRSIFTRMLLTSFDALVAARKDAETFKDGGVRPAEDWLGHVQILGNTVVAAAIFASEETTYRQIQAGQILPPTDIGKIPDLNTDPSVPIRWYVTPAMMPDFMDGYAATDEPVMWYEGPEYFVSVTSRVRASQTFKDSFSGFYGRRFNGSPYVMVTPVLKTASMEPIPILNDHSGF